MTFRRVALVLGIAAMLTIVTPLQAKTVTLGYSDNRTDVSLNLGDTLVVELSSGDVNGFAWVSHLPKDSGLTALNDDLLPADKKAAVPVQTYRGAPHGDVTISDRGEWAVLRGDAADPDATVYQLNPDDEQHSEALLVQGKGAALMELDRDLKPIQTTMNATLKRVP